MLQWKTSLISSRSAARSSNDTSTGFSLPFCYIERMSAFVAFLALVPRRQDLVAMSSQLFRLWLTIDNVWKKKRIIELEDRFIAG